MVKDAIVINKVLNCVEKLKAIDKFIFLTLIYQGNSYIEGNRKQLVKDYGFSEGVVERTLNSLVEAGLLEKSIDQKSAGKRGRPSYQYKNVIVEKLNQLLNTPLDVQTLSSNEKIKSLLLDGLEVDGLVTTNSNKQLKADTKLLLIVLLHHADKFGFVQYLDNATLLKLTGMKRQALEGQIQKLVDLGYICSKVSGINAQYLFGRMSSIYILNLEHNRFISDITEADRFADHAIKPTAKFLYFKHPDSLLYKPDYKLMGKQRFINFSAPGTFEALKLILLSKSMLTLQNDTSKIESQRKADWESRSLYSEIVQLIDYKSFKDISTFFVTKSNPDTFTTLLQFKLNQYASILLSENVFEPNHDNKTLKDKIRSEILHPKLELAITNNTLFNDTLYTEENKSAVVELFYSISFLIASDISKILAAKNFPEGVFSAKSKPDLEHISASLIQTEFRILPPLKNDFRYLTVLSDYQVNSGKAYFLYGDTIVKKSQIEHQLVAEDVLLKEGDKYIYKTFSYGLESEMHKAKKLLQTIESRFLEARTSLSEAQMFCFALHHQPEMAYFYGIGNVKTSPEGSIDRSLWLSPPKSIDELSQ
tara:strand:+ start:16427 stop:18202 length:1776 start_codon:yes stop_codon:yes gene_type:complete